MSKKGFKISQTNTLTIKRMVANGIRTFENHINENSSAGKQQDINRFAEGSTQDYMPVENIDNGFIKTTDGRYVGIVEVYPINFLSYSESEKASILMNYQELYQSGLQKIKIKALCDFFDPELLVKNIMKETASFTNVSFLEARDKYVKHIYEYSNTQTISTRYFIIYQYAGDADGRASKDIEEIYSQMEETEAYIRGICSRCGNVTFDPETADGRKKAVANFLYFYFNRNSSRKESLLQRIRRINSDYKRFSKETGIQKQPTIVDYFASKGLRFTNRKFLYTDGMYYAYLGILPETYPDKVPGGWMNIFNFLQFTDLDITSVKYAKEFVQMSIGGLNKVTESNYNRQVYKNRVKKAMSAAVKLNNNRYVQSRMSDYQEELWKTSIIVTVKAPTQRALRKELSYIKKELNKVHIKFDDGFQRVEQYYIATMPFLCNSPVYGKLRHDTLSSQMSSMYCFTSYGLYDYRGYLLGKNIDTHSLICLNNFDTSRYKNGNTVLIGTSGAGKTFTEEIIGTRSLMNGMRVFSIIPVKGYEYAPGCKMVGGTFVKYYPGSKDCLNPMEIRPKGEFDASIYNLDEDDVSEQTSSLLARKVTFLIIWLHMQTQREKIDSSVYSKLQEVIPKIYLKFGITDDNDSIYEDDKKTLKKMPILSDMHEEFKKYPELKEYTAIVSGIINGPFSNLNGQTNVDMSNPYIVFDVDERYIGSHLIAACLYAVFEYVSDNISENPLSKDLVILDEVWKMLRITSCAERVKELIKLIRGYGGYVMLATQEINDFINSSDYGISVLNNSEIKVCLNLKETELKMVKEHLNLTDQECKEISNFKKGQALFISNNNKVKIAVEATDVEMYAFTTDVNKRREMAEKKTFDVNKIAI